MKNLFLSVILLLTVSFTFAANDVETVSSFGNVTVELTNPVELAIADFTMENDVTYTVASEEVVSCGFPVYFDDGGTGDWGGSGSFWMDCDDDTTLGDILDVILALFF